MVIKKDELQTQTGHDPALVDLCNLLNELQNVPKNRKGYGYTYADLGSILEYVKPILKKHNYFLFQTIGSEQHALDGKPTEHLISISTTLKHITGYHMSDTMTLPPTPVKGANSTQAIGASITYARRYSIGAMLGISTDDDTDGVTTQKQEVEQPTIKPVHEAVDKPVFKPVTKVSKANKPKGNIEEAVKIIAMGTDVVKIKEELYKYSWNADEIKEIKYLLDEKGGK